MDKLNKELNDMQQAKRNNKLAMVLIVSFSAIISLTTLTFYFTSRMQMIDLVKVVDVKNGMILNSDLKRRKAVLKSTIKGHIERAVTCANSFSRNTIKTNQKKTLFLMDMNDAYTIFGRYKKIRSYEDALQRGHIYQTSNIQITNLDISKAEPYPIRIEAILTIKNGTKIEKHLIEGQGDITYHDPIYPQNEAGLWLSNYRQKYTKIANNE